MLVGVAYILPVDWPCWGLTVVKSPVNLTMPDTANSAHRERMMAWLLGDRLVVCTASWKAFSTT